MNAKIDSEIVTLLAIGYFLIALPALIGGLVILAIPIPTVISSGARGTGLFFSMFGLGLAVLATGGVGTLSLIAGYVCKDSLSTPCSAMAVSRHNHVLAPMQLSEGVTL